MIPVFPLARLFPTAADLLDDPAREADGLTLVLTGIQCRSFLEQQIALGIADAGVPGRIEIVDWTTGNPLRFIEHLRFRRRAAEMGQELAERVVTYRREWPDRPVNIVGYSGGGYLTLVLLEALPPGVRVTRAVLLAPSCSKFLDVEPLAARTDAGLIHVYSPFDVLVLGLLTLVVGTMDGRHVPSAGMVGFRRPEATMVDSAPIDFHPSQADRFREMAYRLRWFRSFHYGGHFGYANRIWAAEILGRLLREPLEREISPL